MQGPAGSSFVSNCYTAAAEVAQTALLVTSRSEATPAGFGQRGELDARARRGGQHMLGRRRIGLQRHPGVLALNVEVLIGDNLAVKKRGPSTLGSSKLWLLT